MRQIFVVYETDAWHSTNHRKVCRCFHKQMGSSECHREEPPHRAEEFFDEDEIEQTSKRVLEAEAKNILRKELDFAHQTQGYETNYDIEVWNINEWYLNLY